MKNIKILDLYKSSNEEKIDKFTENTRSSLVIDKDLKKVEVDFEWLELMEKTIPYLDNILRNPNRFIINEEEVVKVELARRITAESIRHLSSHTNYIQEIDDDGEVKPSKILNINKEESYNTYENRFIYSLIQNMKGFIARKKSQGIVDSSLKSNKKLDYSGTAKIDGEDVNISMQMSSNLNGDNSNSSKKGDSLAERIEKLELKISDLTSTEVYKTIQKLHIALVTSPIKKTNVILKNVNFQYAVKLWNYMQENLDDHSSQQKDNKNYEDTGELKEYADETFLLYYLIMNTLNKDEHDEKEEKELSNKIVENMVRQVVTLNTEITLDDLNHIVEKQYEVIKYEQVATSKKIEEIFNKHIEKYLSRIDTVKI